jgi:hypothetical protein
MKRNKNIELMKTEIYTDFARYYSYQSNEYEDTLEMFYLNELDKLENEYVTKHEMEINEYDSILKELNELDNLYCVNLNEYIQLQYDNQHSNERLLSLNQNFIQFVKVNYNFVDIFLVKYSLICLASHLKESRVYIENLSLIKARILNKFKNMKQMENLKFYKTNFFSLSFLSIGSTNCGISLKTSQNSLSTTFILIENLDRVLDLNLSEWCLTREINNPVSISTNTSDNVCLVMFKFPRNFVLRRRKKLYLLTKNFQDVNSLKNKESDVLLADNVVDWGIGISVMTKLVNNRNIVKFININALHDIWFN